MLPFLKRKEEVGSASNSEPVMRKHDDGEEYDPMEAVAQDMLQAHAKGDHRLLAQALRAAHDLNNENQDEDQE